MWMTAKVAVEKTSYSFDRLFDYRIPYSLQEKVQPGIRVLVPFGGGNRLRQGMVMEIAQHQEDAHLKPINTVVDETPILDDEMLGLMQYLRSHTFCTWYDAVHVLLPLGISMQIRWRYTVVKGVQVDLEQFAPEERWVYQVLSAKENGLTEGELCRLARVSTDHPAIRRLMEKGYIARTEEAKRRVKDETEQMARLTESFLSSAFPPSTKLTLKQQRVVEQLLEQRSCSVKELCYLAAVTKAVLSSLEKKGILELYQQPLYRPLEGGEMRPDTDKAVRLSAEQQTAEDTLWAKYREGKACVALLRGVTGSGKTQVYLSLIRRVLAEGRNVIVLVPEISLTPQVVGMFRQQFGSLVAVLHSGLSPGERMDQWKRLRDGEARIAVGTRSAVFAPLKNIGLIVMDEEQESTYKSGSAPRYHARDVAKFRCMTHNAMLLLASATPSVESYYQAVHGRYLLVTLENRYAGHALPAVQLIDMNEQSFHSQESGISDRLAQEIEENLKANKQTILLLNRRGYNTIVKCSACGTVASCPNCSISLTYHASNQQLICHYCGYTQDAIERCSNCGSKYVRYTGIGTQKAEQSLQELFPSARILRMDADTTMTKFSHEKYFSAFGAKKYDIMIGTQMVAKGLDFPDVTLVGVLSADMYLYSDDFRSSERTFDLLTQVVGRGGRGTSSGRACIQTFSPTNDVIGFAARQDYLGFYQQEIAARKMMLYPPFCDLCAVCFSGQDQQKTREAAAHFWEMLRESFTRSHSRLPVRMLGPVEGAVLKINNKYRYKIIIKCRNTKEFRQLLSELLCRFGELSAFSRVSCHVDMGFDGMP